MFESDIPEMFEMFELLDSTPAMINWVFAPTILPTRNGYFMVELTRNHAPVGSLILTTPHTRKYPREPSLVGDLKETGRSASRREGYLF